MEFLVWFTSVISDDIGILTNRGVVLLWLNFKKLFYSMSGLGDYGTCTCYASDASACQASFVLILLKSGELH